MPVITLELAGELTDQQRSQLAKEITEAVVRVANKNPEHTHIIFKENPRTKWARAGRIISEVDKEKGK